MRIRMIAILVAMMTLGSVWAQNRTFEELKQLEGYTQKLEKGAVQPLNNPEYIAADQAEIPDNAWVIGVVHNGAARAYSMNLLFNYNVVNDADYALFWDPIGNVACAYDRKLDGQSLSFMASGGIYHGAMVYVDQETDTFWAGLTGKGLAGPNQDKTLTRLPIVHKTIYGDWKKRYPETTVMAIQGLNHNDRNPLFGFVLAPQTFAPPVKEDKAYPPKTPVYTFYADGKPYGVPFPSIGSGWTGKAGSSKVFIWRPDKAHPYYGTLAWNIGDVKLKEKDGVWQAKGKGSFDPVSGKFEDGSSVMALAGVDTYWYVWTNYEPKAKTIAPPRVKRSEFETESSYRIGSDDPFAKN